MLLIVTWIAATGASYFYWESEAVKEKKAPLGNLFYILYQGLVSLFVIILITATITVVIMDARLLYLLFDSGLNTVGDIFLAAALITLAAIYLISIAVNALNLFKRFK